MEEGSQDPEIKKAFRDVKDQHPRRPVEWLGLDRRVEEGGVATKKEVTNSTLVVLIAVVYMTTLIFLLDYGSSKFVLFLFD